MHIQSNNSGFTARAAIIATFLSLFLLASTLYIAVKLGAAPWPIIFSVIVSASIIRLLNGRKKTVNLHEINVAQAGGSIGGLIAAGLAFTLPGIIYFERINNVNIDLPDPLSLSIITAAAGLLGLLLSVPLKFTFIDEENLPYPSGTAGAELLKLAGNHGKELYFVLIIGSCIGLFTLLRDQSFPVGFTLISITSLGILIPFLPLPIAVGAGYILGPKASFSWFSGALAGWLVLMPLLIFSGNASPEAAEFIKSIGMGMVMGSGISFLFSYILPRFRRIFLPAIRSDKRYTILTILILLLGLLSLLWNAVPFGAALLTVLGIWAMVAVAARMTGETNIDPLEQFGIFIALIITGIYAVFSLPLPLPARLFIAMTVSIACAIAGDAGHDYKSAAILKTRFSDIVKIDAITVIVTSLAAPFIFQIFMQAYQKDIFTTIMPAPQAQLVAESLSGFKHPVMFFTGFAIAFAGEILPRLLKIKYLNRLLWMPFGIGLFLGPGLALPIASGALIYLWISKKYPGHYHTGIVIAAGVMGAEGIAGFSAGALTVFGISFTTGALIIGAGFLFTMIWGIGLYFKHRTEVPS